MWEEVALAYFEVLSQNMPGDTEESHEEPLSRQTLSLPRFELATSLMITW
jgi:hypothetical protein